eukprot:5210810-Pleurochrysis_carterae.AAC.7
MPGFANVSNARRALTDVSRTGGLPSQEQFFQAVPMARNKYPDQTPNPAVTTVTNAADAQGESIHPKPPGRNKCLSRDSHCS